VDMWITLWMRKLSGQSAEDCQDSKNRAKAGCNRINGIQSGMSIA
jgi:hypothetical protein